MTTGATITESIHDKIKRSIQAAAGLYHRLVLLVGETGSGKTGVLRDIAGELGSTIINVNLTLSGELLELTARQRVLRLPGILEAVASANKRGTSESQCSAPPSSSRYPVILDNIEILFDKGIAPTVLVNARRPHTQNELSGSSGGSETYCLP